MFAIAEYTLRHLLGVAGATVALIISGSILLQGVHTKYKDLMTLYRELAQEYRANSMSDGRRDSVRSQLANYRRRIAYMQIAYLLMTLAVLLFLLTVAVASVSVLEPESEALRLAGTVGLFGGLALIASAVCLDVLETVLSRRVIEREVQDFTDLPSPHEAWRN